MPQILIPSALRIFTEGQSSVDLPGDSVKEVLSNLSERYPEVRRHLFDEKGTLRNFVNVFVGDEDVRNLNKGDTLVKSNDVVSIIPAVAGGYR